VESLYCKVEEIDYNFISATIKPISPSLVIYPIPAVSWLKSKIIFQQLITKCPLCVVLDRGLGEQHDSTTTLDQTTALQYLTSPPSSPLSIVVIGTLDYVILDYFTSSNVNITILSLASNTHRTFSVVKVDDTAGLIDTINSLNPNLVITSLTEYSGGLTKYLDEDCRASVCIVKTGGEDNAIVEI
jgi:hypothetical protein